MDEEILKKIISEINEMSTEEFEQQLEKARNGDIAKMLRYINNFGREDDEVRC